MKVRSSELQHSNPLGTRPWIDASCKPMEDLGQSSQLPTSSSDEKDSLALPKVAIAGLEGPLSERVQSLLDEEKIPCSVLDAPSKLDNPDVYEQYACITCPCPLVEQDSESLLSMRRRRSIPLYPPLVFAADSYSLEDVFPILSENIGVVLPLPFDRTAWMDQFQLAIQRGREPMQVRDWAIRRQSLSKREKQVFVLVTAGLSNRIVASELGISQKTVEVHRSSVMKKMEAKSLASLVRMAVSFESHL